LAINRHTPGGRRDYTMFSLMLNTGARVQEILNLRVCDVRLEPPYQVRLAGKDNRAIIIIEVHVDLDEKKIVARITVPPDMVLASGISFKRNAAMQMPYTGSR